jgi:hypothetical protein
MSEMSKTLFAAAAALLLMTMRLWAHHAFAAEYDENKRVTRLRHSDQVRMDQSACLAVPRRKG